MTNFNLKRTLQSYTQEKKFQIYPKARYLWNINFGGSVLHLSGYFDICYLFRVHIDTLQKKNELLYVLRSFPAKLNHFCGIYRHLDKKWTKNWPSLEKFILNYFANWKKIIIFLIILLSNMLLYWPNPSKIVNQLTFICLLAHLWSNSRFKRYVKYLFNLRSAS